MTTPVYGRPEWGQPAGPQGPGATAWPQGPGATASAPDTNLIAERAIQYIIDSLITMLSLLPPLLLALVGLVVGAPAWFYIALGVLWFVLSYVWSAWVWIFHPHQHGGQTWGMRVEEIKVVDAFTLGPATRGQLAIRWVLLLLVDGGLIGLLLIAITEHHQRLGDMAAKTLVVRVDDPHLPHPA